MLIGTVIGAAFTRGVAKEMLIAAISVRFEMFIV
jgi:uncharacterized membrane protein (DUF441 family)